MDVIFVVSLKSRTSKTKKGKDNEWRNILKCNTNFINKKMSTFSNLEQRNLKNIPK